MPQGPDYKNKRDFIRHAHKKEKKGEPTGKTAIPKKIPLPPHLNVVLYTEKSSGQKKTNKTLFHLGGRVGGDKYGVKVLRGKKKTTKVSPPF